MLPHSRRHWLHCSAQGAKSGGDIGRLGAFDSNHLRACVAGRRGRPSSVAWTHERCASHAAERARARVRDAANFPKPDILFRDITPLFAARDDLADVLTEMARPLASLGLSAVLGMASRRFLLGLPIAQKLRLPFVLARKPSKLPSRIVTENFTLEYGTDSPSVHTDAFAPGDQVVVADDVPAAGGTAAAACRLVERSGATVAGVCVLSEFSVLGGRMRSAPYPVHAHVTYDH